MKTEYKYIVLGCGGIELALRDGPYQKDIEMCAGAMDAAAIENHYSTG